MNIIYGLFMISVIVYLIKRKEVYNPYEEELSGSGYYESSFVRKETCTEEICTCLDEIAGYKRLLRDFSFEREILVGRKRRKKTRIVREKGEILMIHEAGIFVITSANLPGNIRGNVAGRYWIQSFQDGFACACRNFIANPFMENKKIADIVRWQCRDIPKLPFYSLAVFGRKGYLETEGCMEENKWSVSMQAFPMVIADIMRHRRKFLKPEEVELVYERLMNARVLQ